MNRKDDFQKPDIFNNDEPDEITDSKMQEILDLLKEIPQVPVPAQFDLNLRRALKAETAKKKTRIYRKLAAVAAVFAVGVTSVLFAQDGFHVFPEQLQDDNVQERMQESGETRDVAETQPQLAMLSDEGNEPVEDLEDAGSNAANVGNILEKKQLQPDSDYSAAAADENKKQLGIVPAQGGIDESNEDELQKKLPSESMPESASLFDGGNRNGSSDYGSVSGRSGAGFRSMSTFEQQAAQQAADFSQAIGSADVNALCAVYSEISAETADAVGKLYKDLFQGKELTLKKIEEKSLSGVSQAYLITGNGKQIEMSIKAAGNEITIEEPILNHGIWLYEQLKGTEFTLNGYSISSQDGSVTFQVSVHADENHTANEVRSITWKKTES